MHIPSLVSERFFESQASRWAQNSASKKRSEDLVCKYLGPARRCMLWQGTWTRGRVAGVHRGRACADTLMQITLAVVELARLLITRPKPAHRAADSSTHHPGASFHDSVVDVPSAGVRPKCPVIQGHFFTLLQGGNLV